ncbi:hypothetical protein Asp14428_69240 [Actinoplanes sp. NBRC 14428]|uniref:Uncharacterized protein n=1 Tax=Pseudosporangium ferrugineum TaxID=439699 RepID=A0A2T0RQH9_9ACTN|nr:hypothetical protein [Pseudosporangium ferrugineum]PRY23446.1 hypothetical protein CLV70_115179 [Pseudosporangium ferrugineum]BCJ55449.1 hypothetical protein Asp14428_69240 [Actinoplanes sp. NBRC 14428]
MNDLDDLKDAMHSPPDFEPRELDLGAVMIQGGRLRRRRRLAVGATSAAAVLVLLVGGGQLVRAGGNRPDGGERAAASATATAPGSAGPAGGVQGDVISTGLTAPGGEPMVLWFQPLSGTKLPAIGLVAGRRAAGGALAADVISNDAEGEDRTPGFHAAQAPMMVDDRPTPAFGYFVGDPVKITVEANGRRVTARLARWSDDPSVVAFWFDPAEVKPDATLKKLTAYGKNGEPLPGAGVSFAVG